jgi:hypothetical protein
VVLLKTNSKSDNFSRLFCKIWHNTEKWLVKSLETKDSIGFERSLMKHVSSNFFHFNNYVKKNVAGVADF